jgi:pyruvate dehydrogenase E2 component (dihydrolipoamide acetyltransferase)
MPIPITIPRLGWNMEEGVFVGWLKRDGDAIKAGDSLFSLESEKATEDVECLDSGMLRFASHAPKPGDSVRVGDVIGFLLQPEEDIPSEANLADSQAAPVTAPAPVASHATPGADATRLTRSAETLLAISPRAKRVAAELGVDWKNLKGSGRTGRICEHDVRAAAEGAVHRTEHADKVVPLSSIRRTIAGRLRHSLSTTASVTLNTTADARNLVNVRNSLKARGGGQTNIPSFTDFFLKLTAMALQHYPRLNSRWENNQIVEIREINIGIAIDTEAGLMAPVICDVARLTLPEIVRQTRDLIDRARMGKLHRKEMEGGTFTISNLGVFGIDAFTPIINWPECAVLGIGRIRRQPVVTDHGIVAREQVTLSLTFDHRIVDGADAARFLQTLASLIENPTLTT